MRGPESATDTLIDESGVGGCPNRQGWVWVHSVTREVRPARCRLLRCDYCVHLNASRRAAAIALARPQRAILLTQVGDQDFAQVRERVKVLKYRLSSRYGVRSEMVWQVEPNPRGTGHHLHGWQWGDFVPQRALSSVAQSVGMGGWVSIQKIRSEVGVAEYGLKGLRAMGYGLKGLDGEKNSTSSLSGPSESVVLPAPVYDRFPAVQRGSNQVDADPAEVEEAPARYLRLNGGRLTHQTRGFFRSAQGVKLAVRDAEAEAVRAQFGAVEGESEWVLARR